MEVRRLSVGLFRKSEENELEDYEMTNVNAADWGEMINLPGVNEGFSDVVASKLQQLQENPEQYFNFGLTYPDFKAYMLKLTYCRAMRKFIERKRLEKIAEFQKNNNFTFNFEQDYEPQP
jgi:hypothetical protein